MSTHQELIQDLNNNRREMVHKERLLKHTKETVRAEAGTELMKSESKKKAHWDEPWSF